MSTPSPRYGAFISYSSSGNGKLAQALQRWLERFATPWYAKRRLRVFRDYTSLAAGGDLGANLVDGLAGSEWFLLLASPEAARSAWVAKEVGWWREHRTPARVIVVLVGGRLRWDTAANDWDWAQTNALPPTAQGMFPAEPLWVDLTAVADTGRLDRSNPELLNKVAQIAATLRGVDKDTIVGEHLTLQRRARRQRGGGVLAMAVLLVAALVASVLAVNSAAQAREQTRIATARALAAASVANLDSRIGLAQLLAVEAYRLNPDAQSRAALFQSVTASPALQRYLIAPGVVTRVAGTADASVILAGTADGDVVRWDARGRRDVLGRLGTAISGLAISPDGSAVAAASERDAFIWTRAGGVRRLEHGTGERPSAVGVSPSGRTAVLATVTDEGDPDTVTSIDTSTMDTRQSDVDSIWTAMAVPSDAEVVLYNGGIGLWQRRSLASLAVLAGGNNQFGVHDLASAISADGKLISFTNGDVTVPLWRTAAGEPDPTVSWPFEAASMGPQPNALAVSTAGSQLATASGGKIYVAAVRPAGGSAAPAVALTGLPVVNQNALAYLDDGTRLLSGSGTEVVLWNTAQAGRVGQRAAATVPSSCSGCSEAYLTISPDGRYAVVAAQNGDTLAVHDLESHTERVVFGPLSGYSYPVPAWRGPGHELVQLDPRSKGVAFRDVSTLDESVRTARPDPAPPRFVKAVATSPDDRRLIYVDGDNRVAVRDLADGHAIADITVTAPRMAEDAPGFAAEVGWAAINASGTAAALVVRDGVAVVDIEHGTTSTLPGAATRVGYGGDTLVVQRPNGDIDRYTGVPPRLAGTVPGDENLLGALSLSSDGSMLATARVDGTVVLRDPGSGETIGLVPGTPRSPKVAIAFARDGARMVLAREGAGGNTGELEVWSLVPADWMAAACASANRDLTRFEWERYVGTTPPDNLRCLR